MSHLDLVRNQLLKNRLKDKKGVLKSGTEILDKKKLVVPVSPSLNPVLGGGIEEGTFTILSGPPKCGKTNLSLQIAANAQNLYNKHVYLLTPEGRLKRRDLRGVHNLKTDEENLTIICSEEGAILTSEDYINSAIDIINLHPGCIVIIDSASALCASGEFEKGVSSSGRNEGPKMMASFCRQMGGTVPAQGTIVIIIQHLIANTSGYGPPQYEDGGRKIFYQADNKLRCKSVKKWEKEKRWIGNILSWEIVCAGLLDFSAEKDGEETGSPLEATESYFRFGYGIDDSMELVTSGSDLGLIEKKGAWYYPIFLRSEEHIEILKRISKFKSVPELEEFKDEIKFQGQENLKRFISDNQDIKDALYKAIKDMS